MTTRRREEPRFRNRDCNGLSPGLGAWVGAISKSRFLSRLGCLSEPVVLVKLHFVVEFIKLIDRSEDYSASHRLRRRNNFIVEGKQENIEVNSPSIPGNLNKEIFTLKCHSPA